MKLALRIAFVCGALPMLAGASLFLLWIATKQDWLVVAGFGTIYAGLALFVVGLVALGCYLRRGFRTPGESRRKLYGNGAAALALLLANFPVAWGIVATFVSIETRYTIVVRNESAQPLSQVRLFGGGMETAIFSIPPRSRAERTLRFFSDGDLTFEASMGTTRLAQTVESYVTPGLGGSAEVVVDAGGRVSIVRKKA